MKIVWLSVNSSYSHSSLALPLLHSFTETRIQADWHHVSATIHDDIAGLTAQILQLDPDVLAASSYLFNHRTILDIVHRVRLLCPCKVILGGPQFLGDNAGFLRFENDVTAVIRGEGEVAFADWLQRLNTPQSWHDVSGLCWWDDDDVYHDNGFAECVPELDHLPSPLNSRFFDWSKPFVQLETTRGCFGTCSYCTSANTGPIRCHSWERTKEELETCRKKGKLDIRLIDRTFNSNAQRAAFLLNQFRAEFSEMHLHLEVHPEQLAEPVCRELQAAPDGMLHIEVGLQTTSAKAYEMVRRAGNPAKAWQGVKFLCSLPNIDVHVDLIAGLPGLNFAHLLDDLVALTLEKPAEIQLEILKVLPGTPLYNETHELHIRFAQVPPYEVLRSSEMTFAELEMCRKLSKVIDQYYNSPVLQEVVHLAVQRDSQFYLHFLTHLDENPAWEQPSSLTNRFIAFFKYAQEQAPELAEHLCYQWMKCGFSAQHGICDRTVLWKDSLPDDVELFEGTETAVLNKKTKIWHFPQSRYEYWFVYDRGKSRNALAVYHREITLSC